jgi:hypothetical protein
MYKTCSGVMYRGHISTVIYISGSKQLLIWRFFLVIAKYTSIDRARQIESNAIGFACGTSRIANR